ncbi:MAG TPA: TorF family putative porin [Steroidobacteraceae bacterium]|nr:TorF family putative porin [Steroidobacteraceae bacterium]
MLEARSCGCEIVRQPARAAAWLVGITLASTQSMAANEWGGSVALSSDYYVRGISRTSDQSALQLDGHYASQSGFLAGAFASNTQIDPGEPRDVELSGFIGYAHNLSDEWRGKIMASHYAYPWNRAGSHYNYDELDFDLAYQGWLHFGVGYSPNSPRFLPQAYRRLIGVTEKSAELSLQRQVFGKLSVTAGAGYSFLGGPESAGYAYWSGGAAYDFQSLTLILSYVNTTAAAKALFYNAAATGEWTVTAIWRF